MDDEIDGEGFDDADDVGDEAPASEPSSAETLTGDIEEAIAKQRSDKGDPEPYRDLEGRPDSFPGGRYEGLEQYAETARRNGTDLRAAVRDYAGVETALRKDFTGGVEHICQRMGVDPRALIGQLQQRYYGNGGNQHAASMGRQQVQSQANAEVAEFAKSAPHFEELRMEMARLAQAGKATNVKQAYSLALKANPTLHAKAMIAKQYEKRDREMSKGRR